MRTTAETLEALVIAGVVLIGIAAPHWDATSHKVQQIKCPICSTAGSPRQPNQTGIVTFSPRNFGPR
jgi:hypothetical protein